MTPTGPIIRLDGQPIQAHEYGGAVRLHTAPKPLGRVMGEKHAYASYSGSNRGFGRFVHALKGDPGGKRPESPIKTNAQPNYNASTGKYSADPFAGL
jgi:hypothetical protein